MIFFFLGPAATICTHREIQCLQYAEVLCTGFFLTIDILFSLCKTILIVDLPTLISPLDQISRLLPNHSKSQQIIEKIDPPDHLYDPDNLDQTDNQTPWNT